MKILRLNLAAFGPFTDTVLDLEGGTGGLHIIYGPNEAGKSSALRALRQMLFGIPARSSDDFIHPYGKLRVGGTLQRNREEVLEFIRRKGRVNTLRGADDETIIDETLLKSFLNGVDENLFTTMFGIDHAGLVQGGREIIRGGGDVGQTLFAAGSGISHFHRVQSDLRADAEALFKPSGQKPRINAGISEFRKNRKAMHDAQLPGTEWEHHDSALGEARLRRTEIETDLTQKERERNRLERTEEALPLIARRRALLSEYEAVANAVLLPENFADARRQAFEDLRVAESQEAQALEHLREIEQRMAGSVVPEQIIGNADTITALFQELGSIRKAAKDRLRLEGLRSNMRSDAGEILKDLRPDLDIEQAGMLRIEKQETVRIQELGAEHTRLTTRLENAQEEIRKRARQMERLSGQLAQLQPPPTPRPSGRQRSGFSSTVIWKPGIRDGWPRSAGRKPLSAWP
ncbi:hypothetical protein DENIS_2330 [Desulfonema ishimotonii]|uniref:YhaN AAA domain-containing protein n=1 Tax=Desulfonema ishimotonii TaxID=45657 RepID=A0A401FWM7_9BACT|nr:YhaN family protein [Desulfonema ishimotonii]GBC61370.1 hypothetical protein DENIS_2330 [Desulfonema ishimotonii]